MLEYPCQFGDCRHLRLAKEARPARIEAAGKKVDGYVAYILAELSGITNRGQRVEIGNEIECFPAMLKLDGRLHHAEVVAKVQSA